MQNGHGHSVKVAGQICHGCGHIIDFDILHNHFLRKCGPLIQNIASGIFLVTGPTGSGKTTTLYSALKELNRSDKKIITAEDPVEYYLPGVNQVEVKHNIGLDFARVIRAMLRQAPNVILVGEMRDLETAKMGIQASLTGHLVFSTLHTNDAPSSITRLIDMGIQPFLVASSLMAVMAQRLPGRPPSPVNMACLLRWKSDWPAPPLA